MKYELEQQWKIVPWVSGQKWLPFTVPTFSSPLFVCLSNCKIWLYLGINRYRVHPCFPLINQARRCKKMKWIVRFKMISIKLEIRHGSSFLYNHEDIVSFALKYTAEQMAKAETGLRDHILYFDVSNHCIPPTENRMIKYFTLKLLKEELPSFQLPLEG